ncbi:MAG: AEC family transporter [Betaproteobacteria bacterium]|nr:AEC family transporter [Betaproteobacteria bacterium]
MITFLGNLTLALPLFALVFVGFALMRFTRLPNAWSERLSWFVFSIALPAMLFRLMSKFSKLPPGDLRLLLAFFGSCLVVFAIGRIIAWKVFAMDGVEQSVFALGGIFSNTVMLGLPLATLVLGDAATPSVALILVFNALILRTLVTASVEWARHGSLSLHGGARTLLAVLTNPIVAAIVSGTLFGFVGLAIPDWLDVPLSILGQLAAPLALIALGMGLSMYGIRVGLHVSLAITAIKTLLQPLVVWMLARFLDLPAMETQVVVLLASIGVGANVYLMSRQFKVLEGPVAGSLVLSTAFAALTTPLILTLTQAGP